MYLFEKIIGLFVVLICLIIAEYHWPNAVIPSFFAGLLAAFVTHILHDFY
jgi:hypothetical protein